MDADNDGFCEKALEEGEDFVINFQAYKLSKGLFTKS